MEEAERRFAIVDVDLEFHHGHARLASMRPGQIVELGFEGGGLPAGTLPGGLEAIVSAGTDDVVHARAVKPPVCPVLAGA